jgi:soluble lytic murein transglycosylase-like protein
VAQTQGLDGFRELRARLAQGRETASLSASMARLSEKPTTGRVDHTVQLAFTPITSHSVATEPRQTEADVQWLPEARGNPNEIVRAAACRWGVPPDLALALLERESGVRNDVVGEQGEIGSAQILPATAVRYGFDVARLRTELAYNVDSGVRILRALADHFQNDWHSVLRAYNGGPDFANSSRAAQIQTEEYANAVEAERVKHDTTCP